MARLSASSLAILVILANIFIFSAMTIAVSPDKKSCNIQIFNNIFNNIFKLTTFANMFAIINGTIGTVALFIYT